MSYSIKLYMDEHIPSSVTQGLRQHNVDIPTTQEAGLLGAPDERQLAYATQEDRVFVTMDVDVIRLHKNGVPQAGIAFIQRQFAPHVGLIIEWLVIPAGTSMPSQMWNHIEYCFDPTQG
ncbi:MAG: DUF5615 family PIN-like protein [Chloroflexota bacterium]